MSLSTEVILASEAAVAYGAVAMSTDYDCWKTDEPPVTWDDILHIFKQNAQKVTDVLTRVISRMES